MLQIAIAVLAVGLVLACVAALAFLYRHQKANPAPAIVLDDRRE